MSDKVTDPRHILQVIKDGVTANSAAAVENHLVTYSETADTAMTAHELYPVVEPALKLLVGGLPNGSNWQATLTKFVNLMDAEVADMNETTDKVIKKATGGKAKNGGK